MVRYWTMRYEAERNFLKKLAQNLGNFINIAWTLASRHQQWQCYKWSNTSTVGQEEPEIGLGILCHIILATSFEMKVYFLCR